MSALSPLERAVRRAAATGEPVEVSKDPPKEGNRTTTVRASVIRDALAGTWKPLSYRGLRLTGCHIDGDLDLSFLHWQGELRLQNCHVDGEIILDHARVVGQICLDGTRVRSVHALNVHIEGSLLMRDGFTADKGLYAVGATISGSLNLRRSHFTAPVERPARMAIELFRAKVGDLFLSRSTLDGGMFASGMVVQRNLRIQGSVFSSRESLGWPVGGTDFKGALALAGTKIEGTLYLSTVTTKGQFTAHGPVTLRSAGCRAIYVHPEVLDAVKPDVEGFTYVRLHGVTSEDFLRMLESTESFYPLAYTQLASYCQSTGDLTIRRKCLIALEKRLTRRLPAYSLTRAARACHGLVVGYGYRAVRSVPILVLVVLVATVIVHQEGTFLTLKSTLSPAGEALSWGDSVGYTVDSIFPFASFGFKEQFVAKASNAREWLWLAGFLLLKFASWGLAALALASFTGVIRKAH